MVTGCCVYCDFDVAVRRGRRRVVNEVIIDDMRPAKEGRVHGKKKENTKSHFQVNGHKTDFFFESYFFLKWFWNLKIIIIFLIGFFLIKIIILKFLILPFEFSCKDTTRSKKFASQI